MTIEEMQFYGQIRNRFEKITGSILPGSEAEEFLREMRREYLESGSTAPPAKWIQEKLNVIVLSMNELPKWTESVKQVWPFWAGKPMVYIESVITAGSQKSGIPANLTLLIFGSRVSTVDGWEMKYTIVEQHPDL